MGIPRPAPGDRPRAGPPAPPPAGEAAQLLVQLQVPKRSKAWIATLFMLVGLGIGVVERLSADRAETGAVGPAERLGGQREDDGVVGPALEVELSFVDVGAAQLLVVRAGLVDLADVDLQRQPGVLEAAHTGPVELGSEAQPEGVTGAGPGDVEPRAGEASLGLVGLAAEGHLLEIDIQVETPRLAVRESEVSEVDDAGFHEDHLPRDRG